ncbi:MAG: hypothetical protein U9P44_00245, partial [archaeon]|nr:hypothetical protein [archaeon]
MYRKIKGTEFGGDYNRLDASGVLKDFGIKEIYSLSDVDLGCVLDYLLREKPQPITEHAYMFGKYMVKFYPPESFGFLSYCQQLGLPVESPVAMGV